MRCLVTVPGLGFAVLLGACAPELDLPPPPDIQARLDAFDSPNATVGSDDMAMVAEDISALYDGIDRSAFHEEVLEVIGEVQDEIYNERGEVDLGGGVTFPSANGFAGITFICEGWEDPTPAPPNPDNGTMLLNMLLAQGSIASLVWGFLEDCKFLQRVGDRRLQALYRGGIAVYFEEPLSPTDDLYRAPVTFVVVGFLVIEGIELPINDLFRVTFTFDGNGNLVPGAVLIDILVELADETSFVYSFDTALVQQLRDGAGVLNCSLENSNCTSEEDPSRSFSW